MNNPYHQDSTFWKIIGYITYIFAILFPFLVYRTFLFGGSSSRATNLIILGIGLGIAFACWLCRKGSLLMVPKSPIALSISAYFIFLVISGLLGLNFGTTFWSVATRTSGIWYLLNLGFVTYILWALVSNRGRQNMLILSVIISTALFSFLSFLSPEGINLLFKGYVADAFTFGNSTFAAMYIFGAFLLSLYYLFQSEIRRWWMYVLPVVMVINPNIINNGVWFGNFSKGFVGEARASTYVILASLIFLFVIWCVSKIRNVRARSVTAYSIFAVSIVAMVFSAISLISHDGYLRKAYLSEATGARPLVWEMSEKVIAQRPYLGWGGDNFERVFEVNYDNRLLQDEYGNEAWFDRAHNVFIDQLVDNGFVGLVLYILMYLTIIVSMIFVALKSSEKKDRILASVLIVYFALHFVELQTAFDTTISYFMVGLMTALAVVLFGRTYSHAKKVDDSWVLSSWVKYSIAAVLIAFSVWSFIWGWIPSIRAQFANGYIRTVGSSDKRLSVYPVLFASPIDEHSFLWRTVTDFQRGISENPKILDNPAKVESLKKELVVFENEYKSYVKRNPMHFRAKLNLADILIYQKLFGIDKLKEAQAVLDEAIKIVPQAPQPYWMKAVAYVYMKKFDLAREYAKKAQALNPNIKQSQDVINYVEKSIKTFPEIDLYFFRQI